MEEIFKKAIAYRILNGFESYINYWVSYSEKGGFQVNIGKGSDYVVCITYDYAGTSDYRGWVLDLRGHERKEFIVAKSEFKNVKTLQLTRRFNNN